MVDLSKLTAKQLDDLVREAQNLAVQKRAQEKNDLRDKVLAMIQDAGFHIDEIFPGGKSVKAERAPVGVKYRDPSNPGNTWKGKGRKPEWLKNAEAAGRPLKDFVV